MDGGFGPLALVALIVLAVVASVVALVVAVVVPCLVALGVLAVINGADRSGSDSDLDDGW